MDRAGEIAAQNQFSLAHPEFYEPPSRCQISAEYLDRLRELGSRGWTIRREDVWLHAHVPGEAAPEPRLQGFKIHLSASLRDASRLLDLVLPVCAQNRVSFKVAADPRLLGHLNSKGQWRAAAGKFITIYPSSDIAFTSIIEELYQATQGQSLQGPYILSDRRYKDSKIIFYRYGGFRPLERLNVDGSRTYLMRSPTGELVTDERLPYFRLPDWVADPFGGSPAIEREESPSLHGRYRVQGAFGFSNAGGIYFATDDRDGREVVIKEARPYTNGWQDGDRYWDAVYLLEHEYAVLERLRGLDFVPAPIDLFRAWEHAFLVEERVKGVTLDVFWAQDDVILAPYIRRPGTIERFQVCFKQIALALLRILSEVHTRGIMLGDLSPRNVLIDPETRNLHLIDFESAIIQGDDVGVLRYAARWGTQGFVAPGRESRESLTPADDWYAAAMTLYSCVVPVTNLFSLRPDAESVFLDRFVALGVPIQVKETIQALRSGDVQATRDILQGWHV